MKRNIQLLPSGISLVDEAWGGFYKCGSYLLIGPRKSGRTLVSLQYARQAALNKEVCVYFTTMRPKDLLIHAASIDFDLQSYMNQNLVIVVRVAEPTDVYEMRNPDEYLMEYMNDVVTIINQYQPGRFVFDEITPYIGFSNMDILKGAFTRTIETIEDKDVTSLFVVGEPVTPVARHIVDVLTQNVTGIIHLQKNDQQGTKKLRNGKISIVPNIGHTEGQFNSEYTIEPYKGIVVDLEMAGLKVEPAAEPEAEEEKEEIKLPAARENIKVHAKEVPEEEKKAVIKEKPEKVPVTDEGLNKHSEKKTTRQQYGISNFYEYSDFLLLLNNQIALFKSTGLAFTLITFRLDNYALENGLLSTSHLQNAIKHSTDIKDKICVKNEKIIVLITRSDQKSVPILISKLHNNLPVDEPDTLKQVLQHIAVFSMQITDSFDNAESVMDYLLAGDIKQYK